MKFNWLDYLSLAENLVNEVSSLLKQSNNSSDSTNNSSLDEAKLRCAISRAYYSVFCLARNYLRDVEEDYEIRKWKEYGIRPHQYVIGKFQESNKRNYKTIGINLERFYDPPTPCA